jgi:hypothetical protein
MNLGADGSAASAFVLNAAKAVGKLVQRCVIDVPVNAVQRQS